MIYADTDFLLAIAKDDDWLKTNAQKIYNANKNEIVTSVAAIIEIAIVCKKRNLDLEIIFGSLFEIVSVEGVSLEEAMEIAHLIKDEGAGVFDSFHAVLSKGRAIASSDNVYDRLGKQRIKL